MTIPQIFFNQAVKYREKRALIFKDHTDGSWHEISWLEFSKKVKLLLAYLRSIGIKKGDRVLILSENRPEWVISDLAILSLGAISVPAYYTSTSEQIKYIIENSGAKVFIVSTEHQLGKIVDTKVDDKTGCKVGNIVLMDNATSSLPAGILSLSEVFNNEVYLSDNESEAILDNIDDSDTASILYTSGTTGDPKGVILTHKNFISNASACLKVVHVYEDDLFLSFLPLSHGFERTVGYYAPLFSGATIAYAENIEKLLQNIQEVRPTIILGVPRFYEKTYSAILDKINKGSWLKKNIFNRAIAIGQKSSNLRRIQRLSTPLSSNCLRQGDKNHLSNINATSKDNLSPPPDAFFRFKEKIASILVFNKIKAGMGGRLRFFISGGAPLSPDIQDFFDALGLVIIEGYGLTETSPVITCNSLTDRKRATVGRPLPGIDVKISDDGEIITRGENLMTGYYNNDKATKEVIKNGWFHTGDIGALDDEGYLSITDRKKDIIVTSGGKNISPQNIESTLIVNQLIKQVMVYGDCKKYLTALIVPDIDMLEGVSCSKSFSLSSGNNFVNDSKIVSLYAVLIDDLLTGFASHEKIRRFILLKKEFSMESGEITPTLKMNRKRITKRYQTVLDDLYEKEWELDK